jgi:hypothetical protein
MDCLSAFIQDPDSFCVYCSFATNRVAYGALTDDVLPSAVKARLLLEPHNSVEFWPDRAPRQQTSVEVKISARACIPNHRVRDSSSANRLPSFLVC